MQKPQDIYLNCVKRVLRYVIGMMEYDILYKADTVVRLKGFTDAD